mgnify:CR=1 FL=1
MKPWMNPYLWGYGTYVSRKIADKVYFKGIKISTCWVDDFECYETALIDSNGGYPVERYGNKEAAITGHTKWSTFEGNEIICLGTNDGIVLDREMILGRDLKPE